MTSTTASQTETPASAFPVSALLTLAAATFVMVTAEMLPTAVLVPMSVDLGVDESWTGNLVALWALTVVVASLPLTRLTRRADRRLLVVAGLAVLALSSLATALGPTYAFVLAARLLGAAAVGLLWATANAHVAEIVPEKLLGRAIAIVLGGATTGLVIGTPLARLLADTVNWRAAFVVLSMAALGVAMLVRVLVPRRPRSQWDQTSTDAPVHAPLTPTIVMVVLVGLLLSGYFGAYTFITRLGEQAAGLLPGGMSTLLLGFGLAAAAGVILAGRSTRHGHALVVASAVTAVALLGLTWATVAPFALLTILVLGITNGALPTLAQTEILRRAGAEHRDLAAALIPVVFNGGIAVGAAAASLLVGQLGHAALPGPAAAIAGAATVGLAAITGRRRVTSAAGTSGDGGRRRPVSRRLV